MIYRNESLNTIHQLLLKLIKQKIDMGLDIYHVTPTSKTLETIDYFTLDDFHHNPDFLEKYEHLLAQNDYEDENVLYHLDKGYQRKRVTANFIHEFENDKLYFYLDDVIKAKGFIEANPGESQSDLENEFQKNFIDNFGVMDIFNAIF